MTATTWLFVLLSPFFLVATIFGVIVIVALCKAASADVPTVFRDCLCIFKRLIEHLPMVTPREDLPAAGDGDVPSLDQDVTQGEVDVAGEE